MVYEIIQIILSRRKSDSGKTTVACSGAFAWNRFRHAKEIDNNIRQDFFR